MSAIEIQGLSKRFGEVVAVDDLSFTARAGAVTGFLGPNGAGKSTTLRMLLGLVRPSEDTATIGGKRYVDLAEPFRRVGAVLEADAFHPGRRARDHLRVLAVAAGLPLARVVDRGRLVRKLPDAAASFPTAGRRLDVRRRALVDPVRPCDRHARGVRRSSLATLALGLEWQGDVGSPGETA